MIRSGHQAGPLPQDRREKRFLLVDALRGPAGLAVVLRHLFTGYLAKEPSGAGVTFVGHMVRSVAPFGAAGVEVFFVLSGFVIAHSLRHNELTPTAVRDFIIRRQVRLDPPYWAAMVLFLSAEVADLLWAGVHLNRMPSSFELMLNAIYGQYIAAAFLPRMGSVLNVAWTLCIEVQFYLLFIGILIVGKGGYRRLPSNRATGTACALVVSTGLLSLVVKHLVPAGPWFSSYWYHFAGGVLAYWSWRGVVRQRYFFGYLAAFAASTLFSPWSGIRSVDGAHTVAAPAMLVGLGTVVLLWYSGRHGTITGWGSHPLLQWFGRMSYSLYLTHEVVLFEVHAWLQAVAPGLLRHELWWKPLAVATALGFAWAFHLAIEQPSMNWAGRMKRGGAPIKLAPVESNLSTPHASS